MTIEARACFCIDAMFPSWGGIGAARASVKELQESCAGGNMHLLREYMKAGLVPVGHQVGTNPASVETLLCIACAAGREDVVKFLASAYPQHKHLGRIIFEQACRSLEGSIARWAAGVYELEESDVKKEIEAFFKAGEFGIANLYMDIFGEKEDEPAQ